jgi:WD40 repeat protein
VSDGGIDGLCVCAGHDGSIVIWDCVENSAIGGPFVHASRCLVSSMAFSADNTKLVTAGGDCMIRMWEVTSQMQLHQLGPYNSPDSPKGWNDMTDSVIFSENCNQLIFSCQKTVFVLDVQTQSIVCTAIFPSRIMQTFYTLSETKVIAYREGHSALDIWDIHSQCLERSDELQLQDGGIVKRGHVSDVCVFARGRGGRVSGPVSIGIWSIETGLEREKVIGDSSGEEVRALCFTLDDARFVTSSDKGVLIWDSVSLDALVLYKYRVCYLVCPAWGQCSDRYRIVGGSLGGQFCIWDLSRHPEESDNPILPAPVYITCHRRDLGLLNICCSNQSTVVLM